MILRCELQNQNIWEDGERSQSTRNNLQKQEDKNESKKIISQTLTAVFSLTKESLINSLKSNEKDKKELSK